MNTIKKTEIAILQSDKNTMRNKKGYSRLLLELLELKKRVRAQLPRYEQSRAWITDAYAVNKIVHNKIIQILEDRQQESSLLIKLSKFFCLYSDMHLFYLRELATTYAEANLINEEACAMLSSCKVAAAG